MKIESWSRELLKSYHGPEPYDPNDPKSWEVYWKPKLNKYHRDNLISLFNAIGYGAKSIKPFHVFNTGDWVGEIPQKLAIPVIRDDTLSLSYSIDEEDFRPNQTRESIERNLINWLRGRLHALDPKAEGKYCSYNTTCHLEESKNILEIE